MSREIKFRAWGKWRNSTDFEMRYAKDGTCFNDSEGAFPDEIIEVTNANYGWIWMQYTGLKDKNGKEICEGDVIDNEGAHQKYEVIFHKGCFCIERGGLGYHIFNEKEVEIIGNIYENPELLTP